MPYDEHQADRVREVLRKRKTAWRELKMMGGCCFMVDDKMCCAVIADKDADRQMLMVRLGEEACAKTAGQPFVRDTAFSVRKMKGFRFVEDAGFDAEADLERWVDACLAYNPLAPRSKSKR